MVLERKSGILLHPTAFPSSYGIGDLGQGALDFIDFAHKSSVRLWQVLPLGPTSFGDSPYQSFSTFAGNPLLISPDVLLKEGYLTASDLADCPAFDANSIDYGEVIEYKTTLFKKAYDIYKNELSGEIKLKKQTKFDNFCKQNMFWLEDFALFVALKQHFIEKRRFDYESEQYLKYKLENLENLSENAINDNYYGAVWGSWPEDIKRRTKIGLVNWRKTLKDEIEYYKFLQFLFFFQWRFIKNYANTKDISIIGDIPIFVAMDSADVWANNELFYLDPNGNPTKVAGVPPDYFSATGQLWGNPLYDWDMHKATNYDWWVKRINETLKTVDILRIDHFRGFDAYWAVDYGEETAIKGQWRRGPGEDLFVKINAVLGELPIIAEDLGVITESVRKLRDTFNFPGMRVLQFAFEGKTNDVFLPHNFNTQNTVVYSGTHDNDTTIGWYEKADEKARDYFRRYMNVTGENPSWDLIRLAISSTAAFAIVPLQDVLSLGSDARVNTPGTASGNWKFRYKKEVLTQDLSDGLLYLNQIYNRVKLEEDAEEEIDLDIFE